MALNVSIKAVVLDDQDRVLLGRNPRQEWELLGGRPDAEDASPQATLRRELREEAGIDIIVGPILDSWIYDLGDPGRICIVTYLATPSSAAPLLLGEEHSNLAWFTPEAAFDAPMPQGYKNSIASASTR